MLAAPLWPIYCSCPSNGVAHRNRTSRLSAYEQHRKIMTLVINKFPLDTGNVVIRPDQERASASDSAEVQVNVCILGGGRASFAAYASRGR